MKDGTNKADNSAAAVPPRRDSGATFIELLVAVVLLGTVVVAVLVALQASTVASTVDAEHARAYSLLHQASDAVFTGARATCEGHADPEAALIATYQSYVNSLPSKPEGWETVTPVITKIEFLNASDATGTTVYSWGPACFEGGAYADVPLKSQKVTIEVTSPDGGFTKLIETVKR